MKNRILLSILCLIVLANTSAQKIETSTRIESNFNFAWKFELSDNPEYREIAYDDSEWRELNVPHDWSIEGDYVPDKHMGFRGGFFPEGIGWYRKHFTVDADKKNKQFVIQFDGVYMNSEVYVNGHYCGRRPYGYATFQYDITSKLNFGQKNVIAVRVDNSVPAGSRWYSGSGIYRNVHMIETNYVHFAGMEGVYVTTPVAEADRAVVQTDYTIVANFFNDEEIKLFKKNKWIRPEDRWQNKPRAHECIMRSIIYDAEGKEVSRDEKSCEIYNYDKDFEISQNLEVENPNRWTDTNPYLYTLKSEIEWQGKILDDKVTSFGIRKLEFDPEKGFFVNGERKFLKGVCLHHDGGAVGSAVPEKVNYYRLKKLKEIGCNAVRTAHNPFAPEFYDMCDSMGIFVMDEILDEWTSAWGYNFTEHNTSKAGNAFAYHFDQWAETEVRDIVHRDRNHPSIVMWSVGNELPELRSEVENAQEILRDLIRYCHEEDPTRPVTFGNNGPAAGNIDEVDILGYNYVMGSYDHKYRGPGIYEEERKKYPGRMMVGTETSRNEIDYFLAYRDNPYIIGQFIWTGIQYFGEVKAPKSGQRGWVASLYDMSMNLLAEGAMYASAWSEQPVIHLTVADKPFDPNDEYTIFPVTQERVYNNSANRFSWNWEKGQKTYITVYNNCEEVELKLNGKSLGRKKTDFMSYSTTWETTFKAGKLEAIGYNNGKKVLVEELESTGSPARIAAKSVFSSMKNDGTDVNIIEVIITDKKGRLVSEATNNVKVKVEGSAKLLAIDTGNLYYKGNFKTDNRDAANGYMTVTIQSTKGSVPVKVSLSSEGLESATVEL